MSKSITIFVPCLVDQLYPEMGMALVQILRHFGYQVRIPEMVATCCGQPAFNSGHLTEARAAATELVLSLKGAECVVCPSGSCTAMVRNFYGQLFEGDTNAADALQVASGVLEISEFFEREGLIEKISGSAAGRIGFHNSCHALRELKVGSAPIDLMRRISGYELVEIPGIASCCGFGGLFCVKFQSISETIGKTRLEAFEERRVDTIVSNDPGCIMHLRAEATRLNSKLKIRHLAEFLASAMGLRESLA